MFFGARNAIILIISLTGDAIVRILCEQTLKVAFILRCWSYTGVLLPWRHIKQSSHISRTVRADPTINRNMPSNCMARSYSNVISLSIRGNVALSVLMTAASTITAAVMQLSLVQLSFSLIFDVFTFTFGVLIAGDDRISDI